MSKEIYISSTPHETRLAIVENDALAEMYYERENEYTLAGSIYNGKVTRVLPGMQSSFVDIGLERDAFLYITDFMEEAGDAADFEANANAGDARRAPRESRPDRGSDRGSERSSDRSSDRAPRSERPAPAEPSDSELFTDAVASLDPARPASDRNGDRSRRGGRNRRDRNLNSDGTPRRDRNPDRTPASQPVRTDAPPPPPEPIIESHPDAELGEGAPGADGSRRWRGRRGRRGNRSGEPSGNREAVSQAQTSEPAAATGPVSDAYPEPLDADEVFESLEAPAELTPPAPINTDARPPREDRGGRNDRNRRDRGRDPQPGWPRP